MEQIFEEWDIYAKKKVLIERDINLDSLIDESMLKIVAVTGIRRCGKTSLLILLRQRLDKKGKNAHYINLEDGRIKSLADPLDDILKEFGETGYLLLDEITSVSDWAGWLARNHELLKGSLKIIVSSSRSSLVVPTKPLRGRIIANELYPLSFREYLEFKGLKPEKTTVGLGRLEKELEEYLIYGGFPETVLLKDRTEKIKVLNSYFRDIIGLDISEISNENISKVELFAKYIIGSPYFSASKCLNFFKSVGYKTSKQSILQLEKSSQDSYLFFFVSIFSHSIKDRAQYPRKAYLGDTGFMYSITGNVDRGRIYENSVFLELKRKLKQNQEINYWKDKKDSECDFVIKEGMSPKKIIQVVYEIKDEKTLKRELEGLVKCAKEFGLKEGLIITKNVEKKDVVDNVNIAFIPLWKWVLGSD